MNEKIGLKIKRTPFFYIKDIDLFIIQNFNVLILCSLLY